MRRLQDLRARFATWLRFHVISWGGERGDALLYAASALFAGFFARFSSMAPYRQWGKLAVGPYAAAAVVTAVLAHRRLAREAAPVGAGAPSTRAARRLGAVAQRSREPDPDPKVGRTRIGVFVFILAGATVIPLAAEVAWRADGGVGHVQPEGQVIEQAARRLADGQHLYPLVVRQNHVVVNTGGQPTFEAFFPYLPLMTVFGLPASTHEPVRMTDVRLVFSVVTLLVVGGALLLAPGRHERKLRVLQVLTVLPTAALPLATGGDDMPIVALLLLAMVLARRRRPGWSGVVLGIVSAMKFTAWPLAALALFAARDERGRRAPGRMLLGMVAVVVPVVVPFALQNVGAFVQNVVLFPLGLSGVSSPAASDLPGHLLVLALPGLHRVLPALLVLVGGGVLVRSLVRRPPSTAAEVSALAGWVMTVAILFAPATRVGYVLYPINFFMWSWLLRESTADEMTPALTGSELTADTVPDKERTLVSRAVAVAQKSSDCWSSSMLKRVAPADEAPEKVVGATFTPTSQYQPSLPPR